MPHLSYFRNANLDSDIIDDSSRWRPIKIIFNYIWSVLVVKFVGNC